MKLATIATTLLVATAARADAPPPASPTTPEAATRQYQASGTAPTLLHGTTVRYPFGLVEPTVTCAPLFACDIQLESGEAVLSVALGDSERWITAELSSGDGTAPTPHVVVKPKEPNTTTNLIIGTSRRTYHVTLQSPPESRVNDPQFRYHSVVSWYYPDDLVSTWNERSQAADLKAAQQAGATLASLAVDPAQLHTDYTLRAGKSVKWAPHSVFDDGQHVYIYFPADVKSLDAPVFLAKTSAGEPLALNYRVLDNGTTYMVDTLFTDAELAIGTGRHRQTVAIHRN